MGGANCEGVMGQTISRHFDWVDYVFSGESDEIIGDFVDRLLKGESFASHQLPDGVIGRRATDVIAVSGGEPAIPRAYVADMAQVGSPNYDDYFTTLTQMDFADRITPGLLMETSRGCWWGAKRHCTFCGLNGVSMTHRSKAPEVVKEQMQQLSGLYGISRFEVVDNILPTEYVDSLMPQLIEGDYNIFYETKANLRKHQVAKLAEAGVRWIQPGLESIHDGFLRAIKKGTTGIQNISTLKSCRESGVRISWNILSGAPGEQPSWYDEMAELLPWIYHLQPPYKRLIKIRYPRYSPYFNEPEKYGLEFQPIETYRHIYPLDAQGLFNIAYFFQDQNEPSPTDPDVDMNNPFGIAGYDRIQQQIDEWRNLFWATSTPVVLMMIDHGHYIRILDTRPVATKLAHALEGVAADIYRACLEPVSESRLADKLRQDNPNLDQQAYEQALASLIDNKLLMHLSHCYLSLALSGEISAMPFDEDHPGGIVRFDDAQPDRMTPVKATVA